MLSALFIMDIKGKVIISRNYRGDVPMTVNERFASYIHEKEEMEQRPVFTDEGYTFVYIKVTKVTLGPAAPLAPPRGSSRRAGVRRARAAGRERRRSSRGSGVRSRESCLPPFGSRAARSGAGGGGRATARRLPRVAHAFIFYRNASPRFGSSPPRGGRALPSPREPRAARTLVERRRISLAPRGEAASVARQATTLSGGRRPRGARSETRERESMRSEQRRRTLTANRSSRAAAPAAPRARLQHNNLYLMSVTKKNSNITLMLMCVTAA